MRYTPLVVVALGVAPARADDTAEVRAALDKHLAALAKHDGRAFAATFLPDVGDKTAVFIPPDVDTTHAGLEAIATGLQEWPSRGWRISAASFIGVPQIEVEAGAATIAADVRITLQNGRSDTLDVRMTGLFVERDAGWKAAAVMLSRPVDDKQLRRQTFGGYEGEGGVLAALLEPKKLAKAFEASGSSIVIGTSANERARGAAGARLLKRWQKLDVRIVGDPDEYDGGGWGFTAATVMWVRKKYDIITMTALVIARAGLLARGGKGWRVTSVHFGATR